MDSCNSNTVERENSLDALLALARGSEEASGDLAGSGESWRESEADRERFQRYETSRKQSRKRKEQRASR